MAVNIDFRVKNGLTVSTTATVESLTQSLSTNSGALQVFGGAGIGKNLYVGGYSNIAGVSTFTNITNSVSTTTGALQIAGGVGVGGNLYIGGNVNVAGIINASIVGIITTATNLNNGDAGQIPYQQYTGKTDFILAGTTGSVLVSYGAGTPTFQNTLTLAGVTNSTSTITGAFQVIGGAGVGGNLYVGGTIYGNGSLTGLITTATNIAAGTPGQLHYQSSAGVTGFVGPGTSGQLLVSAGSSAPTYTNTSSIIVGYAANAFTSTNIIGGALGSIPYQSGTGTTTTLPLSSTAGYFLLAGVSAPYWQDPRNIFINTATNLGGGTTGQIPFQVGVGSTNFVGPGSVGQVLVSAGASSTGPVFQNTLTLAGTTNATSTITGAFQVVGGVGIGGNLYIGGDLGTTNSTFNLLNTSTTTINFAGSATSINIGATTGVTTVKNNLTIVGNLTVQGTSTVVDSTVTNITDPILTLGGISNNQSLVGPDNKDKGIAFKYYSGSAKTGFFGYKDSTGFFTFVPDATITNETISGTKGAVDAYLAGGTSQSLIYQSAPNVTAFLAAGTAGTILQTNGTGSAPIWANTLTLSGTTNATSTTTGAFQVVGGAGIGGNLYVGGITTITNVSSSISTTTGALTVAGGAGIRGDLYVGGTIYGTVNGSITTATNIAAGTAGQLHYQSGAGVTGFVGPGTSGQILVSAGASAPVYTNTSSIFVGFSDKANTATNIALGNTGQLIFQTGPGATSFVGAGTAGQVLVSLGNTSLGPSFQNTLTLAGTANSISTTTGAFQVVGGIGVGGNLYVGGITTITNFSSSISTSTGALTVIGGVGIGGNLYVGGNIYGTVVGTITTATNIAAGTAGQLHYQSGAGVTGFVGPGTSGQILVSAGASAPVYTNTSSIFVGFSDKANTAITAGTATNIAAGTAGQLHYQSGVGVTGFVGPGTSGQILVSAGASAPTYTNTSSIFVGFSDKANTAITATNIAAGGVGQIPIQSGVGTTAFIAAGSVGQLLQMQSGNTATWISTGSLITGVATTATNIAAGTAGQLPYQSGVGVTGFAGPGTSGQILVSAGASAPVYTNTSSIFVGFSDKANTAITATNIAAGTAGQLHYQSGVGVTGFAGPGTSGQILVSAGAGAPTYTNTSSIFVGFSDKANTAITATNIAAGTAGQLHYQSGVGLTGFVGPGTSGQILVSAGAGAPTYTNTSSIFVGFSDKANTAITATNIAVGAAGQIPIQSGVGTTAFIAAGTVGQLLQMQSGNTATWVSTGTLVAGIASTATNIAAGTAGQLHYQSGVGVTGFVGPGTSGQILVSAGASAPVYTNTSSIFVGFSDKANTAITATNAVYVLTTGTWTNAVYYPTFVSANNLTAAYMPYFTTSSFVINPSTGYHGIGTASPAFLLDVNGAARVSGNFTATGSLVVGTAAAGVAGEIRATNEITAYYSSDARLKENIKQIEDPITMIGQIRGVYFDWTDKHMASRGGEDGYFVRKHDIGVIAQEIEAILPEIVATRDNGFKAVKYEKIVPLLIEAIKAQQKQIDQIQSMLNNLINK